MYGQDLPSPCLYRSCLWLFRSYSRPINPRENAKNLGITRRFFRYFNRSGAVLAPFARMRYSTAKLLGQQLHSVANAQHRQAAPENSGIAGGRVLIIDTRWPTRQNKAFDIQVRVPLQFRQRSCRRYQFTVDVALAHTTSNQPAVLRSKIKNDNCLPALCGLHVLPFKPQPACSGARHLGVDVARSDRVHVDAERPKFNG